MNEEAEKTKGQDKRSVGQSEVDGLVMPDVDLEKRAFVRKQTEQAMDKGRPFVRCGCLTKLRMPEAYKCLYCGEWYCATCAEEHFGKTRAAYRAEKEQKRC